MPTEAHKPLLDRDLIAVGHRQLVELIAPVLQEAINYSTWAWRRCESAGDYNNDLHGLVPLMLFRHVMEMTDGVEVLVSNSCSVPVVPVLRSAFEACLSLEFIVTTDTERRSLSWLCCYAHQRLEYYESLDPSTQRGRDFASTRATERAGSSQPHPDVPIVIANLMALIQKSNLAAVEAEYQATKAKRKRVLNWYSLFDGPSNLRVLASRLGRQTEYDLLYRNWSRISHGNDLDSYISKSSSGHQGFRSLRYPRDLPQLGALALEFLTRSIFLTLGRYRAGEPNVDRWYLTEIRDRRERLLHTPVEFEDIEHGLL
jgi:Family of unknown function (DUF5677)